MLTNRPKIFVSSTIYDFRDLRSSLKFWLEAHGCEVHLSEFNDFRKPLDENSYEACLRTIDDSQYFVLLIGSRVGGWYDKSARLSITRAEYRRAYERLKTGHIKLLVFVRQEVWDIREDRKALRLFLEHEFTDDSELTEDQMSKISMHASRFVRDAEAIFDFLNEVGRLDEMKKALVDGQALPVGNWIHRFATFREIIDAFRVEFGFDMAIRKRTLVTNMLWEIEQNISELLYVFRNDGTIKPYYCFAYPARQKYDGKLGGEVTYTGQDLRRLGWFVFPGNTGSRLQCQFLTDAVASGEFLEYDQVADTFVVGKVQEALIELRDSINVLQKSTTEDGPLSYAERLRIARMLEELKDEPKARVLNDDLVLFYLTCDHERRILNISRALYKTFTGNEEEIANLEIVPPLPERRASMREETPTVEEVRQWIRSRNEQVKRVSGTEPATESN